MDVDRKAAFPWFRSMFPARPCVLVLHHGDAREQLGQLASEELASGHWRVLHLGVDTKGVQVERA